MASAHEVAPLRASSAPLMAREGKNIKGVHELAEGEPDEQHIDGEDVQSQQRLVPGADMGGGGETRDQDRHGDDQLK